MGKNCSCYLASWYAQTNVTHSSGLPPEKPSVTFTEIAQHKNVPASSSFKHPPLFLFNIYVLSRLDCVLWGRVNPGKIKAELISSWDSPGMVPKRHLWRQKAEPSDHELWGGQILTLSSSFQIKSTSFPQSKDVRMLPAEPMRHQC